MGLDSASNNCFFYQFPPFYLHFRSHTQMPILQTPPTTHSVSLKEASKTCTLITKTWSNFCLMFTLEQKFLLINWLCPSVTWSEWWNMVSWIKVRSCCDIRLVLLVGLKLLTRVKIETVSPGCYGDLEYRRWVSCWCSMCDFNIF